MRPNFEVAATCTLSGVSLRHGAYDQVVRHAPCRGLVWWGGVAHRSRNVSVCAIISDVRQGARRHSPMSAASSASPTSRTATRLASWRCRGPNLMSWVRHGGPSVLSANGPLRQSRASRPAASRGSRLGQRKLSRPWSVQRGLLSNFGQEVLANFSVGVWLLSNGRPNNGLQRTRFARR